MPLLQINWLIVPVLVELCTQTLCTACGSERLKRHRRSKSNVDIAEIFKSPYLVAQY
jgi:hypothetical protein